eukprot:1925048-Rhodomonas_salina.1
MQYTSCSTAQEQHFNHKCTRYAPATSFPVLTWRMVLAAHALAVRRAVLTWRIVVPVCAEEGQQGQAGGTCSAISGTDVEYGATRRRLRHLQPRQCDPFRRKQEKGGREEETEAGQRGREARRRRRA